LDSWPIDALKAQAIAARTYALSARDANPNALYHVYSDERSQVYGGVAAEQPNANLAIEATRGEVLRYNGNLISAYFSSSNGGFTERAEDVWSASLPYLAAQRDEFDANDGKNPNYNWRREWTASDLETKFQLQTLTGIEVRERTNTGRIKSIVVKGVDATGASKEISIRNADNVRITFGLKSIPSALEVEKSGDILAKVTFTGSGWGHTLGMSQWGAKGRAEREQSYRDILSFYYPGAKIEKLW